jgi:hypothetical protein
MDDIRLLTTEQPRHEDRRADVLNWSDGPVKGRHCDDGNTQTIGFPEEIAFRRGIGPCDEGGVPSVTIETGAIPQRRFLRPPDCQFGDDVVDLVAVMHTTVIDAEASPVKIHGLDDLLA